MAFERSKKNSPTKISIHTNVVNTPTPYETIIAAKLEQLPVPQRRKVASAVPPTTIAAADGSNRAERFTGKLLVTDSLFEVENGRRPGISAARQILPHPGNILPPILVRTPANQPFRQLAHCLLKRPHHRDGVRHARQSFRHSCSSP